MLEVLKGTLTRRLILLFMALSIIPTLAVVIVPLIVRVNEQKKTITALEMELQANAEDTFGRLVDTKVSHYEQILQFRYNSIENFTNLIIQNEPAEWEAVVDHFFEQDSALQQLIIQSNTYGMRCFSRSVSFVECNELVFGFQDSKNNQGKIFSQVMINSNNTLFIIHRNDDRYKISSIYDLDHLLNEIPRFGIANNSTLIFIDREGRFLGYPSAWGDVALLDQMEEPKEDLLGNYLENLLPIQNKEMFSNSNLKKYWQKSTPTILSTEFNNEKVFFAFQQINETPISVLLLLPLSDIYGQATFYGASLSRMEILPAVTQAIISAISFLLVIFFGAILTLRVIAEPIKNLHDGASAIANNNLETRVPETGLGEIKVLATAFNHMANSIQKSQKDLCSKQLEIENTLAARLEELSAINGIISLINTDLDQSQKINGVIRILYETLGVYNAKIYLYDPQGKLTLTSIYDNEIPFVGDNPNLHNIDIVFREDRLGKLILSFNPNQPINPIHLDFLQALSTTVGVLIKNTELRSQVRSITISEERRNLARELHDSVTQTLFSVSLAAEGLKNALGEIQNPAALRALKLLTDQLTQVHSEMRGLILELRPVELDNQNLEEAIQGHAASLQRTTSIKIQTEIKGGLDDMPYDIQTALNRIVQESLSNIARHARATRVKICLELSKSEAKLIISDNGIGFDVESALDRKGSYGLINIRERAEIFSGNFKIDSYAKRGTTITVRIPIEGYK